MDQKLINMEELFHFHSHSNWVNKASSWFKPYKYVPTICLDAKGNVCHIGEDFGVARDLGTFPITVYRIIRLAEFKNT